MTTDMGKFMEERAESNLPTWKLWTYYMSEPIEEVEGCWEQVLCYGPYESDDEFEILTSLWMRNIITDDPEGEEICFARGTELVAGDEGFTQEGEEPPFVAAADILSGAKPAAVSITCLTLGGSSSLDAYFAGGN